MFNSKYMVMEFFLSKIRKYSFTFALTGYGFVLPYMYFVHLALLDQ